MRGWTEEQKTLLLEKYEYVSLRELKRLFPDKKMGTIVDYARSLGMNRSKFSIHNNGYLQVYARCSKHGLILKTEVTWRNGKPCCPRCWQRVRWTPRSSKFRKENI